jgi:hypothetical protein
MIKLVMPGLSRHPPRRITKGLWSCGTVMGWTPPDGIDVPKWRCLNTT